MKPIDEILKIRNLQIKAIDRDMPMLGGSYYDSISGKWLNFMFSIQMGWEHLSVSMPSKTPSWDQMCIMKEIFFDDEEECFEYHPKKSEYVNIHPHCLHIWRPRVEERIDAYRKQGLVNIYKVKMLDAFKDLNMSEEKKKLFDDYLKAEGHNTTMDTLELTLADKVPLELIEIPTPPSIMVGTRTREGLDAFKDLAGSYGIEVNPERLHKNNE